MLQIIVQDGVLSFDNIGFFEPQPTRYTSERWEWIAVELACGVADPFPDVGLLIRADDTVRRPPALGAKDWAILPSEAAPEFRSLAYRSPGGWLYAPRDREAVEEIVFHYQPSHNISESSILPSANIIAFSERTMHFESLVSHARESEARIGSLFQAILKDALFELAWNVGTWSITPRNAHLKHLAKLAEPVASRINAVIIEC